MRKHLATILKVTVTLAGLAYVVLKFDLDEIAHSLVNVDWFWFGLGFLLIIAGLFVRAFRWLLLLRGLGSHVRLGRLIELYFVGSFYNAFLPSGFGGDAVRVLEVAQDVPGDVAAGTVIVDRLTGLMMLFVMALLALPFRPAGFPDFWLWFIGTGSIVGLTGSFLLLEGSLVRRFGGRLPGKLSAVGDGPVAKVLSAVQGCGWRAIGNALAVSFFFNLLNVGWWLTSGRSLGLGLPFTYYLLAAPIMSVALLLPSVGGLGVRESLAPSLFAIGSISGEQAATLSLIVFIITRLGSLLGAPVYIFALLRDGRVRRQTTGSNGD